MSRLRGLFFPCLILLLVLCGPARAQDLDAAALAANQRTVLSVSDIHFDPFNTTDTKVPDKLKKSGYTEWYGIYSRSTDKHISGHGKETNFNLFMAALKKMKATCPNPEFILFSGDLLAHHFAGYRSKFSSEEAFHKFIMRTLEFIEYEFQVYFRDTPIIFTLGNNDSYKDYEIAPNGSFLHDTWDLFYSYYIQGKGASGKSAFKNTFLRGGNYSYLPTGSKTNRILSVNSNFFSKKNDHKEQGMEQLKWLQSQLQTARQNKENVWILLHIPPGIDVGGTVNSQGKRRDSIKQYWDAEYTDSGGETFLDKFLDLVREYPGVIKGIFSGHTHMDHFRLVFSKDYKPKAFVHITPAISPQFDNNPGFQVLTYDTQSFSVIDVNTYYYNYDKSNWGKEYDFKKAYAKKQYNPQNLEDVHTSILTSRSVRKDFMDYYDVNNPKKSPVTNNNWNAYWCGITELTSSDFEACFP